MKSLSEYNKEVIDIVSKQRDNTLSRTDGLLILRAMMKGIKYAIKNNIGIDFYIFVLRPSVRSFSYKNKRHTRQLEYLRKRD